MRILNCNPRHFRRIGLFILLLCLFIGTFDAMYSRGSWLDSYYRSFVFTTACAFFCTIFLCVSVDAICRLPRPVYYILFAVLVAAGVLLGVMAGTLILEGHFLFRKDIFLFSLMMGLIFSSIITAYFLIRENLEQKAARIREMEVENERLKRLESETRLMNLRAKLNPHFLFNTLNSTAALIYDDPSKAEESIVKLADLYHRLLSVSEKFVPIKEELGLIEDYLDLEKIRFDDRLVYQIICPDSIKNFQIPGLLIEPLVENAVKHAKPGTAEPVEIVLKVEEVKGMLHVSIRDNGPGFDVNRTAFGFGLYSVQERLRLIFGDSYEFNIHSSKGKGTEIELKIPKRQE